METSTTALGSRIRQNLDVTNLSFSKVLRPLATSAKASNLFGSKRYESFIRSMCFAKLGETEKAENELNIATDFLKDFETKNPNATSIGGFHWMRREAQTVIKGM